MDGTEAAADEGGRGDGRRARGAEPGHRARGITGGAVYLIVIGVTLLVAFANVLIAGRRGRLADGRGAGDQQRLRGAHGPS